MLEGRPTLDLRDPWGGSATAIEIDPHEVREAWEAARARFPGRHPVVVCEWGDGPLDADAIWRRHGRERDPAQVLAAAAAAAPAPFDEPADVEYELSITRDMFGSAPSAEEVRAELGAAPTQLALDRWLLGWEDGRGPSAYAGPHMEWFVPEGQPTYVLVGEARTSEEAVARLGFWGLEVGLAPERLAGLVASWRARFGAELVACWGTMLQFVVERPPQDLETAWRLAVEHWEVAPSTMLLPGVPVRDHARDLVGRGDWFLHERP